MDFVPKCCDSALKLVNFHPRKGKYLAALERRGVKKHAAECRCVRARGGYGGAHSILCLVLLEGQTCEEKQNHKRQRLQPNKSHASLFINSLDNKRTRTIERGNHLTNRIPIGRSISLSLPAMSLVCMTAISLPLYVSWASLIGGRGHGPTHVSRWGA